MSLLVRSGNLGLFVNPQSATGKYSRDIMGNSLEPTQMLLS